VASASSTGTLTVVAASLALLHGEIGRHAAVVDVVVVATVDVVEPSLVVVVEDEAVPVVVEVPEPAAVLQALSAQAATDPRARTLQFRRLFTDLS
jgi:hypothetical protein